MAITYKWNIHAVDTHVSHEGKSDVIYTIHYGLNGSEGDYSDNMIGTHSVEFDKDNFTEYADLKEADVIAWLEADLDVDTLKANIKKDIDLKKNPVSKTYHAPFASSE